MKNVVLIIIALTLMQGCYQARPATSNSGVKKAHLSIKKTSSGYSVEQENVMKRLEMDNSPGSTKHLYLINDQGECLLYSTVKGKVTSSGKRLTPYRIAVGTGAGTARLQGFGVRFGGYNYETDEVLQDDGTYGSSEPYIYWWSHTGQYFQFMKSMSISVVISDQPLRTYKPRVILASLEKE